MPATIFTIGYAGFTVGEFLDALSAHGVGKVFDVRSCPFSHYRPEFDAPAIEKTLAENGIAYRNCAREFGARQEDREFYAAEGFMDFEKFAASPQFRDGVNMVLEVMSESVPALMCAEKDPVNCHRSILVAREFHNKGCEVVHLMPDGETLTQEELERELLDMYFPDRRQGNLFTGWLSDDEMIAEAYRLQNEIIGWRLTESK